MGYSVQEMYTSFVGEAKTYEEFIAAIENACDSGGRARNRVYQLVTDILLILDGSALKGAHSILTEIYGAQYDTAGIIIKDNDGAITMHGQLPKNVKVSIIGD